MGTIQIIGVALSVFDKLLDKMPNYNQKQMKKYLKLKRRFNDEIKSDFPDHGLIDTLTGDLMQFITSETRNL